MLPNMQVAKVGRSIKFDCEVDKLHFWKFNGGKILPHNVKVLKGIGWSSLIVHEADRKNSGTYHCFGSYKDKSFVARGTLRVVGMYQSVYTFSYYSLAL